MFVGKWGSTGTTESKFDTPLGSAVDASGNVYVPGGYQNRVQKFDSAGKYLTEWGVFGSADGEFYSPAGIAMGAEGQIYVTDSSLDRVQIFVGPWLDVFVGEPELPERR